ncbi:hypothetical protein MNBD_CHLOROFLEXI01-1310, partial [hydrothermal vent metagenome]
CLGYELFDRLLFRSQFIGLIRPKNPVSEIVLAL